MTFISEIENYANESTNDIESRNPAIALGQITIYDVSDAYSAMLTNESYTYVGDVSGAPSELSFMTQVIVYCGAQQLSEVTVSNVDCPEGITATISDNGIASPAITFTTTNTITDSCEMIVSIIVDDITINKRFIFNVIKNGENGRGIKTTNVTYQTSSDGVLIPAGEWLADIPETSSTEPYLWTKTVITYTDDTTSTSYSVGSTIKSVEDDIDELRQQVSMSMTESDVTIKIQNELQNKLENGVSKVVTETGFTFDDEGMTVDSTGSTTKTQITTDGMTVYKKTGEIVDSVLTANSNGVEAKNLNASTYLIIGGRSRFENYGEDRTGCFWIGG